MIGFRVDANNQVATGHLMRCVAIAKKCKCEGLNCIFIVASSCDTDIITSNDMSFCMLNSEWNQWDSSIDEVKSYVADMGIELLIVDSYYVTEKFMREVNDVAPVLYIDDLCKEAYNVAAVLHCSQWPYEDTLQRLYAGKKVKLLSGMKYVPLREEFDIKEYCDNSNKILITMGGTDPYHITAQLVHRIMNDERFDRYRCVAVLGKMCNDKELLVDIAHNSKRLEVLQNVSNMGDIMRHSCAAVSAGGISVYELFACKVPMVCVSFADNQVEFARKMELSETMYYAGDIRNDNEKTIELAVEYLFTVLKNEEIVSKFKNNMSAMVDAKGTLRIVEFIKGYLEEKNYYED